MLVTWAARRADRDALARDLEDEFSSMLASGVSPRDARRWYRRQALGSVIPLLSSRMEDVRATALQRGLTPDARLALRMLLKNPALTVVGGFGMAVAITSGIGFFTFMTMYYSDAPVEDGDRVVTVEYVEGDNASSSAFDYQVWKNGLSSFEELAAYVQGGVQVEGSSSSNVFEMTASGFRIARVPPFIGRTLLDSDELEGAQPVLVLAYREWQQLFGGDPAVVGTDVRLGMIEHTIVGIMPEGFRFPVNAGGWTALRTQGADTASISGYGVQVHVFGRLTEGVDRSAAEEEAVAVAGRLAVDYPQFYGNARPAVLPYIRHLLDVQQYPAWVIWLMQIFAGLILAVVAVNVAVLVYARTALRFGEITVRTALGASRSRIVSQLFLEALALSGTAAVIAWILAVVGFRQMTSLGDLQDDLPYWLFGGLPREAIAYAVVLALFGAVIVGVLPAIGATGSRLQSTLRELGSGTGGVQLGRTWTTLICAQVAIAVGVLPAVVGMAWNYKPPPVAVFPASEVLLFRLALPPPSAADRQPLEDYSDVQEDLIRRVSALPGVEGVTFTAELPMRGRTRRVEVEGGGEVVIESRSIALSHDIDPEYFDVLGVPLLAGRRLNRGDVSDSLTVVVNRSFADQYFPDGNALGRRFRAADSSTEQPAPDAAWIEIVGVVEDMMVPARRGTLPPEMFHAALPGPSMFNLAARVTMADPMTLAPGIRDVVEGVAPGHDVLFRGMALADGGELRFLVFMASTITLSVLLLSMAGISAMMSFAVSCRQREIGIRTALGASRARLMTSIFSRSTRQLVIGLLVGTAVSVLVDRATGGATLDGAAPGLVAFVAVIMLTAGTLAAWGPARRAQRIQPMESLRQE